MLKALAILMVTAVLMIPVALIVAQAERHDALRLG
jgi:hypothetical protein